MVQLSMTLATETSFVNNQRMIHIYWGRHSVVGTATHYGLKGPGIETSHIHPDRSWGRPSLLIQWVPGPLPEVKERVQA
jgi:hypothetical protein